MGRLVWALPTEPLCPLSHQPLAHHLLKSTPHLRPGGRSCEVTPRSTAPTRTPPQGAQPTASVAQGRLSLSNQDVLTAAAPNPHPSRKPDRQRYHEHQCSTVLLWTPHPPHPPRTLSLTSAGEHALPPWALRVSQELPEDRDVSHSLGAARSWPGAQHWLSHVSETISRQKDVCLGGQVLPDRGAQGPPEVP